MPEIKPVWAYSHPDESQEGPSFDRAASQQSHRQSQSTKADADEESGSLLQRGSQRGFGSVLDLLSTGSTRRSNSFSQLRGFGSNIESYLSRTSSSAQRTLSGALADALPGSDGVAQTLGTLTEAPASVVDLTDASFSWVKVLDVGGVGTRGDSRTVFLSSITGQPTLRGVSLQIEPGSLTVVTGLPGAGEHGLTA